jgi:probable O-glycosylation ligase (exosortase A-associated)
MRDILIVSIVAVLALIALRRPWIGVMLWLWLSLMSPHRYTFGFAYDAPLAMIAALATLVGFLATRERESPFKGPGVALFVIFTCWVTLTWAWGFDPKEQFAQWDKIMKVNIMVLVCLMLIRTKEQIFVLAWVLTLSVGLLSIKGGIFTVLNGGNYRVWGPSGSWIQGSNDFAVATIMVIPWLRFLQLQVTSKLLGRLMLIGMLLCAAAALGSHSRGALLAVVAMSTVLWWRGSNRVRNGLIFLVIGLLALQAMPDHWTQRMDTIETYEEDMSAQGRLSAWWVSWNLAFSYPLGVGLSITYPELFLKYSPYGLAIGTPVAHSIWFQVLGHHGFIGLALFVGIWATTWMAAQGLRRHAKANPQLRWVGDLGAMAQVSMVGYWVGGAFLQLAYYDFPYYVMAIVFLTRAWVKKGAGAGEPVYTGWWRRLIGLAPLKQPTAGAGDQRPHQAPPRPVAAGPRGAAVQRPQHRTEQS